MTRIIARVCTCTLLLTSCTFSPQPQDVPKAPPAPFVVNPSLPQTEVAPTMPSATVTDNLATPAPVDTTLPDSPVSDVVSPIDTASNSSSGTSK